MALQLCDGSKVFPLKSSETQCGRDRHSDIFINNLHASRSHAIITLQPGHHTITQTGVNSIKIERLMETATATKQEIVMKKGDTVRLANLDVIVFPKDNRFQYLAAWQQQQTEAQPVSSGFASDSRFQHQEPAAAVEHDNLGQRKFYESEENGEAKNHSGRQDDDEHRAGPGEEEGKRAGGLRPRRIIEDKEDDEQFCEEEQWKKLEIERDLQGRGPRRGGRGGSGGDTEDDEDGDSDEDGEDEGEGYSTGDEELRSENSWILSSESDDISIGSDEEDDNAASSEVGVRREKGGEVKVKTDPQPGPRGAKRKLDKDLEEATESKAPKGKRTKKSTASTAKTEAVSKTAPPAKRVTPFELFVEAERDKAQKVFADFTETEIDMVMESRWENLSETEKEKFVQMAPRLPSPKKQIEPGPAPAPAAVTKGSKEGKSTAISREFVKAGFINIVTVPELKKFLRQQGEEPASKKADLVQQVRDFYGL